MTEQDEIRQYVNERLKAITAKVNSSVVKSSSEEEREDRKFQILLALHYGQKKEHI